MFNVFYAPEKTDIRAEIGPMKSYNFSRDHVEKELNNRIEVAAKYDAEHNSKTTNQASQYILDKLASNNLRLNTNPNFSNSFYR